MNMENLQQLARVYNTLMTINTKGEDTIIMADCLRAFLEVVNKMLQEAGLGQETPEKAEELE